MTFDEGDLQNVYQRATRRRDGADCPNEETLIRAARNALAARDREAVIAHLAQCSDCARDYRIVTSLAPWADEASKKHREEDERNLSPFAVAATVAIAVSIPLIVWLFLSRTGASRTIDQLYGEIARRDQEIRVLRLKTRVEPQIGMPIADLDASTNPTVTVPPTARTFAVVVHLPFPHARSIELRDHDGHAIWRGDAPEENDSGSVTINIPRELVPAGDYVLRANGANDHADFPFRVAY